MVLERKKKKVLEERSLNWRKRVLCFDELSIAECFFMKFVSDNKSDGVSHGSCVNGFIDLRTGAIDVRNFYGITHELHPYEEESKCRVLEDLFKRRFCVKINEALIRQHLFSMRLEACLGMIRCSYSMEEDDVRKLTSYTHNKENDLPVFFWKKDGLSADFLSETMVAVRNEINTVIGMAFTDRKKAFLVNYLLILFDNVVNKVDLEYFHEKDVFYFLEWTKFVTEENT